MPNWVWIVIGAAALVLFLIILLLSAYTKAGPDEAIMISGLGKRKILRGKAGFRLPLLQRKDKLSLQVFQVKQMKILSRHKIYAVSATLPGFTPSHFPNAQEQPHAA